MRKMRKICTAGVVALCFALCPQGLGAFAAEDLFADHKKAMKDEADAHAVTVYDAWGDNMARRIERGSRGVLVKNGESSADGVTGDGAGNVTIKKGAKVDGPLIIKNDYRGATIIAR
jgi:hypothetical protein